MSEASNAPASPEPQKTTSEEQMDAGYSLFMDVFRRADKNDDSKVSFAEFLGYFQDDHMSTEDMSKMFETVDTDKSMNIELDELVAYFRKGFDEYMPLFASLEHTHKAISTVLHHTRQKYADMSVEDQFKIRFYLREFLIQLEALHRPIDVALDKISQSTERRREHTRIDLGNFAPQPAMNQRNVYPVGFTASVNALSSVGGFNQPVVNGGISDGVAASPMAPSLHHEVSRLSQLINRLERARVIKLDMPEEDESLGAASGENTEAFVVVCTELDVEPDHHLTFVELTKPYIRSTRLSDGCKYVYVKKRQDTHSYFLYEVFGSKDSQKAHYKSVHYREWAKALIDVLRKPASVNSMFLPAEWWPSDEDDEF